MGSFYTFFLVILSTVFLSSALADHGARDGGSKNPEPAPAQPPIVPRNSPNDLGTAFPPSEPDGNFGQLGNGPRGAKNARPVNELEELAKLLDPQQERRIADLEKRVKKDVHDLIVALRGIPQAELQGLNLEGIPELAELDRVLQSKVGLSQRNGERLDSGEKTKVLLKALLLTKYANNLIKGGFGKDEASNQDLRPRALGAAQLEYQDADNKVNGRRYAPVPRPAPAVDVAVSGIRGTEVRIEPKAAPDQQPFPPQNPPTSSQEQGGTFPGPAGEQVDPNQVPGQGVNTVGKYQKVPTYFRPTFRKPGQK